MVHYPKIVNPDFARFERLDTASNSRERGIKKRQEIINRAVRQKNILKKLLKKAHLTDKQKIKIRTKIKKIDAKNRQRGTYIHKLRDKNKPTQLKQAKLKYKNRAPRVSSFATKKGFVVQHKIFPLIFITEEAIDEIVDLVRQKFESATRIHSSKISSNSRHSIKLVFCDEYGDHISSQSVFDIDEVAEVLTLEMNKHNPTENENKNVFTSGDRYLSCVELLFYNPSASGGCRSKASDKFVFNLSRNELIRTYSPKSTNNRCFDMCLKRGKQYITNQKVKLKPHKTREKLGIPLTAKIDPKSETARKLADEYNVSFRVWLAIRNCNRIQGDPFEKSFKLYCEYNNNNTDIVVDMMFYSSHFYFVYDNNIYKTKCNQCGDYRKLGLELDHKCYATRRSYYQSEKCNNNEHMKIFKLKTDTERNWIFYDLETFPLGPNKVHTVYAVGWFDFKTKKYYYSYGPNSMQTFMNFVLENENKKYIAYNGCKFDFYFLQKELLKHQKTPNFLMNNGRILLLEWKNNENEKRNSVWDLYNFMPGFSLKSACKAFDTDCQKLDFDHNLMQNWECVQKYKNQVLKYLKHDVMSLCELTEKFVDVCDELFAASPTKYITLSSYAEKIWAANFDELIELPDMEKLEFIALSIFGGRTYPAQKRFKSKLFDFIQQNKDNKQKLKEIYTKLLKSNDFIFNGDINSQYPACMSGCDLMPCLYPTGYSKWIKNDPNKCKSIFFDNKQLGIYRIRFKCNKKLRHPILPRKKVITRKNGKRVFVGVEWSLLDGEGVYNTIDIQNAIKHGYKIEFLGTALIWDGVSDNIFKTYIDNVYDLKVKATNENNKVKRQIAKLMMNSLYGKTLQNPICTEDAICRNVDDLEKFALDHVIKDWHIVQNATNTIEYVIVTGEKINDKKISRKPRHLGSFVLGYSRRLWLLFIEAIDPKVERRITSYLDTDSLHIRGESYQILKNKNLIHNTKLGFLSNDCDDNALIFYECNLAPKCYAYLSLNEKGEIKTTMKSKGIMKNLLQLEWFENETPAEVEWSGLKKINKNVSKNDRANGVTHWSIKTQEYRRTFYKNCWKGMDSIGNDFLPFGFAQG